MNAEEGATLNDASLGKRRKGAVFLDRLHSLNRDIDNNRLTKLRDIYPAAMEVGLAADLASWVELGCTRAVRVSPANLRAFASDFTCSRHSHRMVA
jgi:hypothetical protein